MNLFKESKNIENGYNLFLEQDLKKTSNNIYNNILVDCESSDYQLAKEVMLNYEKKKDEEMKRNKCRNVIYKEKEKHERINELERYLEDEKRKRKDFINEKNNNIDVSDDK